MIITMYTSKKYMIVWWLSSDIEITMICILVQVWKYGTTRDWFWYRASYPTPRYLSIQFPSGKSLSIHVLLACHRSRVDQECFKLIPVDFLSCNFGTSANCIIAYIDWTVQVTYSLVVYSSMNYLNWDLQFMLGLSTTARWVLSKLRVLFVSNFLIDTRFNWLFIFSGY